MAVVSGKGGNAKWGSVDIPHVRSWRLNNTANAKPYASSDTSGGMSRVSGNKDSTATVQCYNDAASGIETHIREGDTGTLDLYTDGTLYWSGSMMCTDLEVGAEIEGGDPNAATLQFGQTANISAP